ncbi:MAG: hypothetical protein GY832_19725 [Chloroflexi bacterium]|nr:hypothetical protein [Chloroflexota bacterium]
MTSGLLATKLRRPSIPPKRVQRPHLIQRLNEGLAFDRQITLVSAPAGFGKTICVSEWTSTLDMPVTWLSLDPADDDPGRFFTYLVAALQKVDENLGHEIEGALRSGQLPPSEIISTTLINDILELENRFLLVLDDFQVIQDQFIGQVLETLVANLPQPLHLVMLTREDPPLPLARLRANNQMTEIRVSDLRFAISKVELFLNDVMGLSLSQADIAALDAKTEGWIVGLQLAALSIRDHTDPSSFIATLSGSHRFILSYLTEQVLDRQSEEVQHFLLQTSILNRLNGDLCNAVRFGIAETPTGQTDSHSLLERLFNDNLFLIPLDDEGQWYRYHKLFADLLRNLENMYHKEQTSELHQRASRWYAQVGNKGGTFVNEAIQHALAAADYAMAVRLLESYSLDMLMQWHVKTVDGWMQAIPSEWALESPKANLAFAWMHLLRGTYPQAAPCLERLQAIFSNPQADEQDPLIQAEWFAMQSTLLNAQGQPAESLHLAKQALKIVPEENVHVRSLIYAGLATAYQLLDEYELALEAFQILIQQGRAAGNFVTEMLGLSGLGLMAIERGQLHLAFETASQGVDRVERSGTMLPISAAVYGELGHVHHQWHQLEQAHVYFQRAIQMSTLSGYSDAEIYYSVVLSRMFQIEGDLEAAAQEIQKAVDWMQVDAPARVREEVVSQQVRIYLAQNRLTAAETALQRQGFSLEGKFFIPDLEPDQHTTRPVGLLYISALRILLYRAQARRELAGLKSGIELADRLIDKSLQSQYIPVVLETLLLRAQMHAALGNDQLSRADYAHALELGEPEGFISIFVEEGQPVAEGLATLLEQNQLGTVQPDYVKNVLTAFSKSPLPDAVHSEQADLVEPLTDRELDVLRLVAKGLKYKDIAARLFISLNTVRSHIKAVYGKLNVNNRTKAIEIARQLRLL